MHELRLKFPKIIFLQDYGIDFLKEDLGNLSLLDNSRTSNFVVTLKINDDVTQATSARKIHTEDNQRKFNQKKRIVFVAFLRQDV